MNIKLFSLFLFSFCITTPTKPPQKKYEMLQKCFSSLEKNHCDHIYNDEFMDIEEFKNCYFSKHLHNPSQYEVLNHAIGKKLFCWLYHHLTNNKGNVDILKNCSLKKSDLGKYKN